MTEQLTHVLPEPPPARPKRNGRRRSRQCRGSRARNYLGAWTIPLFVLGWLIGDALWWRGNEGRHE